MANNSIGAYAQGGSNDIGAYEKVPPAAGGNSSHNVFGGPFAGPFAGPLYSVALIAILLKEYIQ